MAYDSHGATLGNAAKISAELLALAHSTGVPFGQILGEYQEANEAVAQLLLEQQQAAQPAQPAPVAQAVPAPQPGPFDAQSAVQASFPGTAVVQAAPSPFPAAPPVFGGPAQIPGVGGGGGDDDVWTMFFNDIANGTFEQNWWDNRVGKTNPRSPDFKHKTWKKNPQDQYAVGLYLTGKTNPAWVAAKLREIGL